MHYINFCSNQPTLLRISYPVEGSDTLSSMVILNCWLKCSRYSNTINTNHCNREGQIQYRDVDPLSGTSHPPNNEYEPPLSSGTSQKENAAKNDAAPKKIIHFHLSTHQHPFQQCAWQMWWKHSYCSRNVGTELRPPKYTIVSPS